MKKKDEKDIELRCEEVQEILTRPPHALIRWGITIFFGVLALLFIGGCFFKYPDIVSAEITITTEHPPVWIVARGSGKIQEVYRKDRETVKAGDIIAVLENPAITTHVLELKERITSFILTDSCICQNRVSRETGTRKHSECIRRFHQMPDRLSQFPVDKPLRPERTGYL